MDTIEFPGKVLLVGEFTVIEGGDALAIPINKFHSKWAKGEFTDQRLIHLIDHLTELKFLDVHKFTKDVNAGWYIQSNIPIGYGLGSSGSVSAAILKKYRNLKGNETIYELKEMLAKIENTFHGTSSGFDPIISYLNTGLFLRKKELLPIEMNANFKDLLNNIRLLDSGLDRNNIVPITWYFEKLKENNFRTMTEKLILLNEKLIHSIISLEKQMVKDLFKQISFVQLEYFQPLIPDKLLKIWIEGIQSDSFYIKLCGKGGGGYYLVYTNEDSDPTLDYKLETIF